MCRSVHPLCFHHSGQKCAAVESSSICARTGHSPSVRKRLRCHEVGEQLFLSHPPAFRVCIFQLSSPFSSVIQTAALTPSTALCTRELHPSLLQGGLDHGTALQFLYCCVLTLWVVIWTDAKLSASHWHPPHPGLPCASQAWGFLQVPDLVFKSYSLAY